MASVALIFLSREASFGLRAPVTIFLICGMFCLVPGLGIYQFAYDFFLENSLDAANAFVKVIKISIAIALRVTLGYELLQRFSICIIGVKNTHTIKTSLFLQFILK